MSWCRFWSLATKLVVSECFDRPDFCFCVHTKTTNFRFRNNTAILLIFYVHRKINFCVLYVSGHWASDACHWSVDDVPAPQIRWHRIAHSYHPANHISRAVGSDPLIGSLGLLLHCQRQSAFALLGKGSFIYYVITFLGIFLIQFPP